VGVGVQVAVAVGVTVGVEVAVGVGVHVAVGVSVSTAQICRGDQAPCGAQATAAWSATSASRARIPFATGRLPT